MHIKLSMIVRNEAHVLGRCLKSVLPLIDSYRIVDTGSTDNTVQVIKAWLGHLDGEILHSLWQNDFAYHRNEALPEPGTCDYVLIMDADDELVVNPELDKEALEFDCYSIADIQQGMINYRPHLFKPLPGVEWYGVRHEDVWGFPVSHPFDPKDMRIYVKHEGDRSKNPRRFLDDAEALIEARNKIDRANDHRKMYDIYTSHIGQSFCDAKMFDQGIKYFKEYTKLTNGLTKDFQYGAYLKIAAMLDESQEPLEKTVKAYKAAIKCNPSRIEAYTLLSFYLCRAGQFLEAKKIMGKAVKLPFKLDAINQMTVWWRDRQAIYDKICETAKLQEVK